MSSEEMGQRKCSGIGTESSLCERDRLNLRSFNEDIVFEALSKVSIEQSSSSTIAFMSLCNSLFISVAFATEAGSTVSIAPDFAIAKQIRGNFFLTSLSPALPLPSPLSLKYKKRKRTKRAVSLSFWLSSLPRLIFKRRILFLSFWVAYLDLIVVFLVLFCD